MADAETIINDSGGLADLASDLSTIIDWLRQDCTARHAEDMAGRLHQAWQVIDELADRAARGAVPRSVPRATRAQVFLDPADERSIADALMREAPQAGRGGVAAPTSPSVRPGKGGSGSGRPG